MKSCILNQYEKVCREALNHTAKITKSFKKVFLDMMILYFVIPGRKNFLQMGRYGQYCEQTYRNTAERNSIDWIGYNSILANKILTGNRRAIAIDPSYITKSGKRTPWTGYFWSGSSQSMKRGLEILGIGIVDADTNECITLDAQQTPDSITLDNLGKNLIDWYVAVISSKCGQLRDLAQRIVADAYFSKITFTGPMTELGFHVISRFRHDAVLFYPTSAGRTGKRGRPQLYDGKIDFHDLDTSRCDRLECDKGELFSLKAYSKALRRAVRLAVWYPDGRMNGWQLYFSTNEEDAGIDVLDIYRSRFQLEFCFRDAKQHTGLTQCQSTSINKLAFNFNAALTSVNIAKAACREMNVRYSPTSCKAVMHNAYLLERFICVSGLKPNTHLIDRLFKELVLFAATAA